MFNSFPGKPYFATSTRRALIVRASSPEVLVSLPSPEVVILEAAIPPRDSFSQPQHDEEKDRRYNY